MNTIIYNGVDCEVYRKRAVGQAKKGTIRTIHTLSHFIDQGKNAAHQKPNTCPFDDAIILYSDACRTCKNRRRYQNGEQRPTYSIECIAFDCRKKRHPGDALSHKDTIVIYPK